MVFLFTLVESEAVAMNLFIHTNVLFKHTKLIVDSGILEAFVTGGR